MGEGELNFLYIPVGNIKKCQLSYKTFEEYKIDFT